ncbi:ST3 beta-galactoside alpha-2,3-sialyltransferase 3a [Etheostoma cragini]|uniref:ST3 beta-galactoside alpha-2,3-sialyltransferase 3a n=1 Tax=Etheostoma cragini TaxID=417921 RepID=UPI00155E7D7F|nr:ST3 beta-galactoside alpha-2,3-sialyltransferase 3a [Etheostoma cragini]XP_034738151.1 ST3 beta-galactoside alpha-2,3-sialyltransferase 3a [Etheostoma cragini]
MRIKPSRNFLLGLCSLLALGWLYYWSWWISSGSWGHNSLYDKQGFLLKLDGSLPLELMLKYGNLSKGACKPGYAAAKMTAIYPKFTKLAPMFLDPNYKRFSKISRYLPPFGVKSQEKLIDILLAATQSYGLGKKLDSKKCKTCIIIGNGGILANKSLGKRINQLDVVIRLNQAPVKGFENDVGSKTTMRISYPEGAIQKMDGYESESLFVLSAFKPLDFKWLLHMVFKQKLRSIEGFWKSVAMQVPRDPSDMRILNPYFIQEASFKFIGLPYNGGMMGRGNIPTLGTVAITMALHNCDEVAIAGFGYNMDTPNAPMHYYEKIRMSAIKESWTHNISKEKEFLLKLVKAGVIQDWTNGICGARC